MPTVDGNGRIVLPKSIRERLGIEPGTDVDVHVRDGKAIVEREPTPEAIIERLDSLIADAASDREAPDQDLHPIAEHHAETIRRQGRQRSTTSDDPNLVDV